MITPGKYDITIYQGATFELQLQYKDNTGTPVNMSGYTTAAHLYNRTGTSKLSNFTVNYISTASGIFQIRIEASGTANITEQGQYDVLITEPGGEKYYLLEGTAFWNPGLTGKGA